MQSFHRYTIIEVLCEEWGVFLQKTRKISKLEWCILGAVAAVCCIFVGYFALRPKTQIVAHIYKDVESYQTIELNQNRDIFFESNGISVHLKVEDGTIRFVDAQCPDKICEHAGALSKASQQAVCLPAKAWIIIEEKT